MEWLANSDDILDKNIYRTGAKLLANAICEFGTDFDGKRNVLWKCLQICFRGIIVQYPNSRDLKVLILLLKLQREHGIVAVEVKYTFVKIDFSRSELIYQ